MAGLNYSSGEPIRPGDRVKYEGEPAEVELVVAGLTGEPSADWYFRELGTGVLVLEPRVFGRVYVTDLTDQRLAFVARRS